MAADDRDRLVEAARRPKSDDTPVYGVPRQLPPPPIVDFTGRSEHLDGLST
ncbi:hypothetical protein [Kribbella qitaiheensis]|uniref:hypothetical protein n=1 Tax=Kribbella qitaiheensis TaxID=1544730 RepID=UPI00162A50BF|nr:hypothetical protein [Kribbella qitaiheensis]